MVEQRSRAGGLGRSAEHNRELGRARDENRNERAGVFARGLAAVRSERHLRRRRRNVFGDNELRFATLSRGALAVAERVWGSASQRVAGPIVVHAHDWHAALSVIYSKRALGNAWRDVPAIFTIHNLAYQGVLSFAALDRLGIPRDLYRGDHLEHFGTVNLPEGAHARSRIASPP